MKPFTESMRYEYPLTPDSLVIDLGCHMGTFSKIISEKYACRIFAFEPMDKFYDWSVTMLTGRPNVEVLKWGAGATNRKDCFGIKGDSSGAFADGCEKQEVHILRFSDFIKQHELKNVDLIKINIEGGEFELLEHIIEMGLVSLFANIQVQFHKVVPDFEKRHAAIREALLQTHQLTYDAPWCWENYERI